MEKPTQQCEFKIGQRVHWAGDSQRIGTVKYVGPVEGYSGDWIGIDWDNRDGGKHDGSVNGVRYFIAQFPKSASFARPHNLSTGVSLLQALEIRYRTTSTKEEEGMQFTTLKAMCHDLIVYYSSYSQMKCTYFLQPTNESMFSC